jgi:hypothetical protein
MKADPIATTVAPTPENRADVVTFYGYLGEGSDPDTFRLYDEWFSEWIELPAGSIVAQREGNDESHGRSYVWVLRDVQLVQSRSATAFELAQAVVDEDPAAARYPPKG